MLLTDARPTRPANHEPDIEAGVIKDARHRQRNQRRIALALLAIAATAALLLLFRGGGPGDTATSHRGLSPGRIHAGALTVSVPAGWQRVTETGHYRDCSNPIIRLDLASYRLPTGFGKHEGAIIVPKNGILLEITSAPVRSHGQPWQHWRLTNAGLRPATTVGPNRYAAERALPSTLAAGAAAWFGSTPAKPSVLAAANRILKSVHASRAYHCQ